MAPPEGERRVKQVAERSRERALQEERLALAAIAKVIVLEVPDPGRLLARLEAMVRAASQQSSTPIRVRQALIDGEALVRNAINRELGRPQALLNPPGWNHVNPKAVDRIVGGEALPQQLGLENDGGLGDVISAQAEQATTILAVHECLVKVLRQYGPATDQELYDRYLALDDAPRHSAQALKERRKELCLSGRVVHSRIKRGRDPVWSLVEDTQKVEGQTVWGKTGQTEVKVPCPECGEEFGRGAGLATHRQAKHGLGRPGRINATSSTG